MARIPTFPALGSAFAVALVAAAIGDPLVESISNTGVFGRAFRDTSQQSAVPALLAGLGLAVLLAIARLRVRFSKDALKPERRLRDIAAALATSAAPRHLATIFTAQLAIVLLMEWSEAWLGSGQTPHGLSWLGAPPLFSLCVQFIVCIACAIGIRNVARSLLAGVVAVLCDVLDRLIAVLSRKASSVSHARVRRRLVARYDLVPVRRLRGRAPPILAASV